MLTFTYRTLDRTGAESRTTIEAASEPDAIATLKQRGLILLGPDRPGRFDLRALLATEIGGARLSASERADFTRELASMLQAGLDLERSLRFAGEIASRARMRRIIEHLRDQVRDGASLAQALSAEAASFPRLYIGLVRAGEESGSLAGTLENLAELLEKSRSLRASIMASLTYPALLLIAAIGAIGFLLTDVLPEFVPIFAENGVKLPGSTRLLLALGHGCAVGWPYALVFAILGGLGLRALLHRPGPRLSVDGMLLRLPVAGALLREAVAARLTRTLGVLLTNGVALVPALAIVQEVIGNRAAAAAIAGATEAARRGAGLARGLESAGLLPIRAIHLLRLGEETGQLGPMALRAAAIHEERTRLGVEKLVALLVPAITVAMGAAIGFIVSSLLLAMLGLDQLAR
ncbi:MULTISPECIES: type II secretion system F family protein [Acidiphilium]|uniref:Type II secretion system protein F (GspF) n=1 Tax=Acidiphilium rubrum TaxID=526 RepID=A0A8G2CIX8_ACIRU|nr:MULTISPECIES: type II secretion system F family protein [Acidiphilium]SIQ10423.1 type II secretion system protein F (GspF) [Acidiphilium rubrum]